MYMLGFSVYVFAQNFGEFEQFFMVSYSRNGFFVELVSQEADLVPHYIPPPPCEFVPPLLPCESSLTPNWICEIEQLM